MTENEFEFDALLDRVINREREKIKNDEDALEDEDALLEYLESTKEEDFHYVKKAADKGCTLAYSCLADRYAIGNGCEQDWKNAFYYWNLSVQNDDLGYAHIGDCYRLGKGTYKDYDKAWEAYEKAVHEREERDDSPSVEELLLISDYFDFIALREVELDWLIYAIKKRSSQAPRGLYSKPMPCWLYRSIAESYYYNDYIKWLKLGADAGDIGAKCALFKAKIGTLAEQKKLIQDIFTSRMTHDDYVFNVEFLAKEIIDDKNFEELTVRFLCDAGEINWLSEHYKKQNRLDDLGNILSEINEYEDDSDDEEEIPEGYFKCSCCGRIIDLDDLNDPEIQAGVCNDCYFTGEYLKNEDDENDDE